MFFISYLFLMLVTIIIGGISYVSAFTTVRKSVEDYNLAMVEQVRTVVDEKMLVVEKATVALAVNEYVGRVSNMIDTNNPESLFTISKLMTEIKNYKINNGFIKGIYIYFSNPNIVVSDEGMFDARSFYEQTVPPMTLTFEDWQGLYRRDAYKGYNPFQNLIYRNYNSEILTYQQSLRFYKTQNPLGSVVVMIDKSYIEKLLGSTNVQEKSTVLIFDNEDKLMLGVGKKEYAYDIDLEKLNLHSTYQTKVKKDDLVVTKVQSAITGWKYVTVVPMSVYYESVSYIKRVVLIITLIQLASGAAVALIMSRKNYEPIKRSIEKLKDIFGYKEDIEDKDYFNFVEEITSATLRENAEIKDNMIKLQPMLKTDLINQLLKGTSYEYEDLKNNLLTVGIQFNSNIFTVCKIHIDDCSKFAENSSIQEMALVKLVITNVIEELGGKGFKIYSTDIDKDNVAILFNYRVLTEKTESKMNLNDIENKLSNLITESQRIIRERFSIFISIGISTVQEGFEGINTAFKESEEALSYNMFRGFGNIIKFSEMEHTSISYVYTLQVEMKLINSIKTADIKKVEEIINELYSKNFGLTNQSLDMARCIFFDMSSTVIKVIDELRIKQSDVWGEGINPLNELLRCKNLHQMQHRLKDVCSKLCEYINSSKKSHNVELKERIVRFVNKNYDDNSISLVWVADELGLNSTYLSYFFKEQVGETFINYITKLRIEKSKKLLRETGMTLQDIAEKIGYTNSGVFIKAFKKLEGCTPGKYRESI
jgi:two-component system, response regulator YesN